MSNEKTESRSPVETSRASVPVEQKPIPVDITSSIEMKGSDTNYRFVGEDRMR
jgi:hypothetical protein